jgi:hypothetical protein
MFGLPSRRGSILKLTYSTVDALRLALEMMEQLDEAVLAEPTRMLDFVEGVLRDEADRVKSDSNATPGIGLVQLMDEVGDNNPADEDDSGTYELLETALSLLEAVLNCESPSFS